MPSKKKSNKRILNNVFKRPNINLLAPVALLVVTLGIILTQIQKPQEVRTHAAGDCDIQAAPLEIHPQEQNMVNQINNYRQTQNRGPLRWDPQLNYPAAWMAKNMTITKRINFTDTFGRTTTQRLVVCGVPSGGSFAENVAIGPANADEVFLNWQTTPNDRTNMLNPLFTAVAVGVEYDASGQGYWSVVFSGPYTGQSVSTPAPPPSSIPMISPGGSSVVPSPNCLGACPTMAPGVTVVPNGSANPNDPNGNTTDPTPALGGDPNDPNNPTNQNDPNNAGNPNDPNNPLDPNDPNNPLNPEAVNGGNNVGGNLGGQGDAGGIIGLFLAFLALILQFFLSLFGRG